jgi:uncharacterized peroxidase-related enzyme
MARIAPLRIEDIPDLEPLIRGNAERMGFVPNSLLTMARRPEIFRGFAQLAMAVMGPGKVAPQIKAMVAYVASTAAGCRYCQAHSGGRPGASGDLEKLAAAWDFETDPRFTAAERAALRVARDGAVVPNATTGDHFTELKKYFADDQIVEIVAVISMFGWLNRWNDTMATELEEIPSAFAEKYLAGRGWTAGRHARDAASEVSA